MAFIRKKKIAGHTYFYLVENRYEHGKVRQKVLLFLGKGNTLKKRLAKWK